MSWAVSSIYINKFVFHCLLVTHNVIQLQVLLLPHHFELLQLVKLLFLHAIFHLLANYSLIVFLKLIFLLYGFIVFL